MASVIKKEFREDDMIYLFRAVFDDHNVLISARFTIERTTQNSIFTVTYRDVLEISLYKDTPLHFMIEATRFDEKYYHDDDVTIRRVRDRIVTWTESPDPFMLSEYHIYTIEDFKMTIRRIVKYFRDIAEDLDVLNEIEKMKVMRYLARYISRDI
jgi:hypothetical protein